MSDTSSAAPAAYTVISQVPSSGQGPDGKFTDGVQITISTAKGHTVAVFVPNAQYTLGHVRPILASAAMNADAIGDLTG